MTAWTDLVSDTYKKGIAAGKPNYKFKDAMKDAAKLYKKTATLQAQYTIMTADAVADTYRSPENSKTIGCN
jgi:hypothetical protein